MSNNEADSSQSLLHSSARFTTHVSHFKGRLNFSLAILHRIAAIGLTYPLPKQFISELLPPLNTVEINTNTARTNRFHNQIKHFHVHFSFYVRSISSSNLDLLCLCQIPGSKS